MHPGGTRHVDIDRGEQGSDGKLQLGVCFLAAWSDARAN